VIDNMLSTFHALMTDDPNVPLNLREVFKNELFRLSLIQVSPQFGMYHSLWLRTSIGILYAQQNVKVIYFLHF
jgi:hypothetical protein